MKIGKEVKRTSVYIPPELARKVLASAKVHRRSFNQELLWLAEQTLERRGKASLASD